MNSDRAGRFYNATANVAKSVPLYNNMMVGGCPSQERFNVKVLHINTFSNLPKRGFLVTDIISRSVEGCKLRADRVLV